MAKDCDSRATMHDASVEQEYPAHLNCSYVLRSYILQWVLNIRQCAKEMGPTVFRAKGESSIARPRL